MSMDHRITRHSKRQYITVSIVTICLACACAFLLASCNAKKSLLDEAGRKFSEIKSVSCSGFSSIDSYKIDKEDIQFINDYTPYSGEVSYLEKTITMTIVFEDNTTLRIDVPGLGELLVDGKTYSSGKKEATQQYFYDLANARGLVD